MKRSDKTVALLNTIRKGFDSLKQESQKAEVVEQQKRTERAMAGKTLSFKL